MEETKYLIDVGPPFGEESAQAHQGRPWSSQLRVLRNSHIQHQVCLYLNPGVRVE